MMAKMPQFFQGFIMSNLDIKVTVLSEKQTQLTVKVPVDTIQKKVESRIRQVAKTAKIDGFRKGKVPVSHIRAQYGAGIQQEVINDTIRDTVFEALSAEKIRAVGVPNIDDVKLEDKFLVYQATVEVFPKVEIQGIDEIEVERQIASISDEDVDVMIENLQKQRQTFETKDGELTDNDQAVFDFSGSINGETFEGGTATDYTLVIGSGRMIPGFEEGMKGMKAGETKTIKVTFPEDYQAENLAGKEADFEITVKEVKEPKLPELNDEFFALFGVTEGGLDKLKADVRKNMEREIKNAGRNQIKQAVFDALLEKNEFDVPNAMLTQEIERQRNLMMNRFAQQFGANPNSFDKDMLPDELFEDQALRAVRLGILVGRVIDTQNLVVNQDRVEAFIKEAAESYEDPNEVIDYYTNDKQQRMGIESVVLEDQVVDYLLSQGKVTEKEVKYQDLLAAAQQATM